jgi:metal transporter CNNM
VLLNFILFQAGLTNGIIGFLSSTVLITIFGEILPQALCSRYALRIGAACVPLMYVILALLFPICKPMAMALDKALGAEVRAERLSL